MPSENSIWVNFVRHFPNADSYVSMDQQLELKLDVKEAPAIPTDHPQWDISESESEKENHQGNESEFTTDSSDEGD